MLERERRLLLVAFVVGGAVVMATAVTTWVSLLARIPGSQAGEYAIASAVLFVVNGLCALPWRITTRPWRVMSVFALAWLALATSLMAVIGGSLASATTYWVHASPGLVAVLFAASVTIALFDLLAAVVAFVALSVAGWVIRRRRQTRYVVVAPVYVLAVLVVRLGDPSQAQDPGFQRWVIAGLRVVAPSIGETLPKRIGVTGAAGGSVAARRFSSAAQAVRGYETWIALPHQGTRLDLRDALAHLLVTLVSGQYHFLPAAEAATDDPTAHIGRHRAWSVIQRLAVAVLPLATVVLWSRFGFGFPEPIKEWVSGLAVLWLLAALLGMLDPTYGSTLSNVRELLQRRE